MYVEGLTQLYNNVGNFDGIVFKNLQFETDISGEYVPPP